MSKKIIEKRGPFALTHRLYDRRFVRREYESRCFFIEHEHTNGYSFAINLVANRCFQCGIELPEDMVRKRDLLNFLKPTIRQCCKVGDCTDCTKIRCKDKAELLK